MDGLIDRSMDLGHLRSSSPSGGEEKSVCVTERERISFRVDRIGGSKNRASEENASKTHRGKSIKYCSINLSNELKILRYPNLPLQKLCVKRSQRRCPFSSSFLVHPNGEIPTNTKFVKHPPIPRVILPPCCRAIGDWVVSRKPKPKNYAGKVVG